MRVKPSQKTGAINANTTEGQRGGGAGGEYLASTQGTVNKKGEKQNKEPPFSSFS